MDFILGAFLHTGQTLPYQNEMVENYLQEARRRFDAEEEVRKRERMEQLEAEERRKREIYLNGGYLECPNEGKSSKQYYQYITPEMALFSNLINFISYERPL